uniref:Uncharacterized protein n=1 Tax=Cyprinus carpio TaxID=7962 RepID=A0A8C1GP31_CYPCA
MREHLEIFQKLMFLHGDVESSDIILVFCPIVSRAGTDIDVALKHFSNYTDFKLAVLVVLHHTFDPEKVVPDSSRCVNRTDILTVDYLFYDDTGILKCQKNSDSTNKVLNWLIQQVFNKMLQNMKLKTALKCIIFHMMIHVMILYRGRKEVTDFKEGNTHSPSIAGIFSLILS